jgi:hypothetical protein
MEKPRWSGWLAERVRPADVAGNMGIRARLWRMLCDYGWFRDPRFGRQFLPAAVWRASRRLFE